MLTNFERCVIIKKLHERKSNIKKRTLTIKQ